MQHLFRQQDDGLYDLAQSVADDLEEEDEAEEESSAVGDNSSPSQTFSSASQAAQDAQHSSMPGGSMPGGKKALAMLEDERLRAAGGGIKKGMKGKKTITCSGRKAPLIT